ncbi:adenylate kinase, partial [Salmonella enterica subsp. enterica serovar Typhimurium]|nr:adenylate kinase [Salmonella enterica subsp. enterica serovar Typhimurium]
HTQTAPLVSYYQNEAKASNAKYFKVDGTQKVSEINAELKSILG